MKKLFALLLLVFTVFSLASCATADDIGIKADNAAALLEFNFYETMLIEKPAGLEAPAGVTDIVTGGKDGKSITLYYCSGTEEAEGLFTKLSNTAADGFECKLLDNNRVYYGTTGALASVSAIGIDTASGVAELLKAKGFKTENIEQIPDIVPAREDILEILTASGEDEDGYVNVYFCKDTASAQVLYLGLALTSGESSCTVFENKVFVGTGKAFEYATDNTIHSAGDAAKILGYNKGFKSTRVTKPADIEIAANITALVMGSRDEEKISIYYCEKASDASELYGSLGALAIAEGLKIGVASKRVFIGTENALIDATQKNWFNQLWHTFIEGDNYEYVFSGLGNTIIITLGALLIGVFLGVLIAVAKYYSEGNPKLKIVNMLCDFYTTVIRGIPITVLLLIFFFVILVSADGVIVAIIAFGINSGAYMAELVRGGINAVDKGQMEAARSLGMSKWQAMRTIIFPQAVKNILPAIGNECIALLKETSVAGYVAVIDLTRGVNLIRNNTYDAFNPLILSALIYLGLVIVMTKLLSILERRLAKSGKR